MVFNHHNLRQNTAKENMRELKFRAWDKVMKSWVPMMLNEISEHVFISPEKTDGRFSIDTFDSKAERFIVSQSTGVKDTNGKELYEGDVVRTLNGAYQQITNATEYQRGVVKWLCEAWKVCEHIVGATYLGDLIECHCCNADLEIIGNIYENPELRDSPPDSTKGDE